MKPTGKTMQAGLIPAFIILSLAPTTDRVVFSGNWALDEGKSEFGQFGQFAARSLKVQQDENAITVDRTIPGFNGSEPVTVTYTVTFDGKETESEGFGGSKRKSTGSWSDNGQAFTIRNSIHFDRDGQQFDVESTETWTLDANGLLIIQTRMPSPQGEITTRAVYSKSR